ncbi:hypothetical protein Tco_0727212 [Tanacetum coccineum]|uniref:Uncharacterized protein n=1 Tax=Tanacetum coccineum TaxID=301880 RepID=A0ABQ4YIP6_9ASTR
MVSSMKSGCYVCLKNQDGFVDLGTTHRRIVVAQKASVPRVGKPDDTAEKGDAQLLCTALCKIDQPSAQSGKPVDATHLTWHDGFPHVSESIDLDLFHAVYLCARVSALIESLPKSHIKDEVEEMESFSDTPVE